MLNPNKHSPKHNYYGVFSLFLFFILGLLYFKDAFQYWFIIDDAAVIWHSTESLYDIFINNKYSATFYTPLLPFSFKPDFMLFGMNPLPYHIHNLLILFLIVIILYNILRLYADKFISLIACGILFFSAPSFFMVSWITLRQYLYPTLFSLISSYIIIKHKPSPKHNPFLLIIILFLLELSFMGKEQFFMLPLLIFVLADGNIKNRIYLTYPYFILLLLHLIFRAFILGGVGGHVGMSFNISSYATNFIDSFFITSKILYGFKSIFILIVLPLIVYARKTLLMLVIVWLVSLSVQLITMSSYPDVILLRYWFLSTLLLSIIVAFGAQSIPNRNLRIFYITLLLILYSVNAIPNINDIKHYLDEKSRIAKTVSEATIDKRTTNGIVLIPEDSTLMGTGYLRTIDRIYSEKLNIKTYPSFVPIELILFYPQFMRSNNIFEVKNNEIINISNDIKLRIDNLGIKAIDVKPSVETSKDGLILKCNVPSNNIVLYLINKYSASETKVFYNKAVFPMLEKIDLKRLLKKNHERIISFDNIGFDGLTNWTINNNQTLKRLEFLALFSCVTNDNRFTLPSDIIYLKD